METIEQIKEDEGGYQAEVYLCTAGKLTWLYGRNIEDRPITDEEWHGLRAVLSMGWNQQRWADNLFIEEVNDCIDYLTRAGYPRTDYPKEVSSIMVNMIYNMGAHAFSPYKWPKFFKAIYDRNWRLAAVEGRDSRWFAQVGHRSSRLMKSLAAVKED